MDTSSTQVELSQAETQNDDEEYEELDLSGDAEKTMTTFTENAIAMCELEDKIKELNAEKRGLTKQKNELKENVIEFMKVKNVRINYGEETIFLKEKTVKGSLSKKKLAELLRKYYEVGEDVDDSTMTAEQREKQKSADSIFSFIEENLGESIKYDLARQKRKVEPTTKKGDAKRKRK